MLRLVGSLLTLYGVYYAFNNLFGMLPDIKERRKRRAYEIVTWLIEYVKAVLIVGIGLILLKLS